MTSRGETAPGTSEHRERWRVLLVDDNLINRKVAVHALARLGCDVDVASDGREAVDKFAVGRFDFILMDCQMPSMDGMSAAREIRDREDRAGGWSRVPIVAFTANDCPEVRERCQESGMDGFAPKPLTGARLKEMLEAWGWRQAETSGP